MKNGKAIMIGMLALGLCACGDKAPQQNVFQPQVDAYKKAQKVEDQILKQDQLQRKRIEDATH